MKLKVDDQGHAVVQDGKPVYVHDDGKEVPFDAVGTVNTITRLNGEAKSHRERAETAEGKLKLFDGIEDGEAARKALETIKNIDEGKLIAAGKVEEIKLAAQKAAQDQVAAASKAHAEELTKAQQGVAERDQTIHNLLIGGSFKGSKLISEKFAIPADMVESHFGKAFKVEEGKVVAYGDDGNKIFSRVRAGELADFDEALEVLVERYPHKDYILKSGGGNGGGAPNSNGGKSGKKSIPRQQFEQMNPAERASFMSSGGTLSD
ncbi:DUF6651 domain-containing protein [Pseudomonas sp. NPDC088444]|uniref:DUF6651 domain-containing protein n=1 Tax=Pseudomonas sp. NPDC088444 TaxID=3364456 RepID=UPI00384DC37D